MKKTMVLAALAGLICQASLNASFNRRWGANSYITNIPLFFKPAYYNQYSNGGCNGCENKVITTNRTKKAPTRIVTKVQTPMLSEHMEAQAQIKTIPTHLQRNERKQTRKLANIKHQEMREKQAAIELERIKLEQELVELEQKKSEFNLAKA